MQIGVDATYMNTNFGGRDLFGFGDIGTFKTAKFPFRPMDYSPWSSKYYVYTAYYKCELHIESVFHRHPLMHCQIMRQQHRAFYSHRSFSTAGKSLFLLSCCI